MQILNILNSSWEKRSKK